MTDFGWHSTTDDVLDGIDLTGKRALVTGVSAGLGVETARALAAEGAGVRPYSVDPERAKLLGTKSEELVRNSQA